VATLVTEAEAIDGIERNRRLRDAPDPFRSAHRRGT
jgi:hypothetical protein